MVKKEEDKPQASYVLPDDSTEKLDENIKFELEPFNLNEK